MLCPAFPLPWLLGRPVFSEGYGEFQAGGVHCPDPAPGPRQGGRVSSGRPPNQDTALFVLPGLFPGSTLLPWQILWALAGQKCDTQLGHSFLAHRPQGHGFPLSVPSSQITPCSPGATVSLTAGADGPTEILAAAPVPKDKAVPHRGCFCEPGFHFRRGQAAGCHIPSLLPRDGGENTRSPGSHVATMVPCFFHGILFNDTASVSHNMHTLPKYILAFQSLLTFWSITSK